MRLFNQHLSVLSLSFGAVTLLAVVYIGLIAVVMSYAVLTMEYAQSVKNDEAAVAVLESTYLAQIARIQTSDYRMLGYAKPTTRIFVPTTSGTALR